ncbi:hypothetical protein D9V09_09990 [Staphylococcus epidermidis]|nr:hypothetical protein D9V09_09990 [Staphylococcus epidermidis]
MEREIAQIVSGVLDVSSMSIDDDFFEMGGTSLDAMVVVSKLHTVMHHKGNIYHSNNIQSLLNQRYLNAQIRRRGGRHKGPPPFTTEDRLKFEHAFRKIINQI